MLAVRLAVLLMALILDRFVGDPDWLWSKLPHPVALFGRAICIADRRLNHAGSSASQQKAAGVIAIVLTIFAAVFSGVVVGLIFGAFGFVGTFAEIVLVSILLAQKSLADHVGKVAFALTETGLPGGRSAVSLIVGRDPESLDEAGVCRAAIESLAENFSDGVVAPAFWYAIFGLPGLFTYKMINTADSMIGHKNAKYLQFGWAAARVDDLANYIPARISIIFVSLGAWMAFGTNSARRAYRIALSDHGLHRSPNAGWPEAAMAGALELQLAGPRMYGDELVSEPMLNAGGRQLAQVSDIGRALEVFGNACLTMTIFIAAVWSISVL